MGKDIKIDEVEALFKPITIFMNKSQKNTEAILREFPTLLTSIICVLPSVGAQDSMLRGLMSDTKQQLATINQNRGKLGLAPLEA